MVNQLKISGLNQLLFKTILLSTFGSSRSLLVNQGRKFFQDISTLTGTTCMEPLKETLPSLVSFRMKTSVELLSFQRMIPEATTEFHLLTLKEERSKSSSRRRSARLFSLIRSTLRRGELLLSSMMMLVLSRHFQFLKAQTNWRESSLMCWMLTKSVLSSQGLDLWLSSRSAAIPTSRHQRVQDHQCQSQHSVLSQATHQATRQATRQVTRQVMHHRLCQLSFQQQVRLWDQLFRQPFHLQLDQRSLQL